MQIIKYVFYIDSCDKWDKIRYDDVEWILDTP